MCALQRRLQDWFRLASKNSDYAVMVIVVTEILDVVYHSRLESHYVSQADSASVFS